MEEAVNQDRLKTLLQITLQYLLQILAFSFQLASPVSPQAQFRRPFLLQVLLEGFTSQFLHYYYYMETNSIPLKRPSYTLLNMI